MSASSQHKPVQLADYVGIENDAFVYWGKCDDRDYHPTRVSNTHVEHTLQLAEVRMLIERPSRLGVRSHPGLTTSI
jgi:hypothetical protein